jgi:YesN/AraC family two-component response regulator
LLKRIKDEVNSDLPYSKDIAVTLLSELIFILCRQGEIATPALQYTARNSELYHSAVVQRCMEFIEEHFAESGLLDRACKKAGLSKSYLRALVKKETGHSFGYHIQQFRVDAARKMLLESTLSLKEITNLIGYESLPFFFKIFRRSIGMSPMEYAKSLGMPDNAN